MLLCELCNPVLPVLNLPRIQRRGGADLLCMMEDQNNSRGTWALSHADYFENEKNICSI